ncbi:MAG TPA: hypothetical protein VGM88_32300 [Kofleriaceae bacterium]|jgi:hypothetical protein
MHDYWHGLMTCCHCGSTKEREYPSRLSFSPGPHHIRVGWHFAPEDLRPADGNGPGWFYPTGTPVIGEHFVLLAIWECDICQYSNWARIIIDKLVLLSMETVPPTPHELDSANYLSDEFLDLAVALSGKDYPEFPNHTRHVAEAIRQYLPRSQNDDGH